MYRIKEHIDTVWLFTQCFGQRLFVFDRATRVGRNNHRAASYVLPCHLVQCVTLIAPCQQNQT
ncbi:hypothetical protein [Nitrosomonas communis]|uniref:hypothetical protein n=1 Tax=Nitrosomonas communis TaxID=44574 RepID=UPI003D2E61D3